MSSERKPTKLFFLLRQIIAIHVENILISECKKVDKNYILFNHSFEYVHTILAKNSFMNAYFLVFGMCNDRIIHEIQ